MNKELVNKLKNSKCAACGRSRNIDICHIRSKGSGGPDTPWNLLPMCRQCHITQHTMSWKDFMKHRPLVKGALNDRGWSISDGKLSHALLWQYLVDPKIKAIKTDE